MSSLPVPACLPVPWTYTPGGFLNVTSKQLKQQSPTLVVNTHAAELAKLVIYESPFLCFCDNPNNVYGQTGEDFVSKVKTTWGDTRFLGGAPDSYVAIAHRSDDKWYVGILNNSHERNISLDLKFLPKRKYRIGS
jgi:alpha-glucosidase